MYRNPLPNSREIGIGLKECVKGVHFPVCMILFVSFGKNARKSGSCIVAFAKFTTLWCLIALGVGISGEDWN